MLVSILVHYTQCMISERGKSIDGCGTIHVQFKASCTYVAIYPSILSVFGGLSQLSKFAVVLSFRFSMAVTRIWRCR